MDISTVDTRNPHMTRPAVGRALAGACVVGAAAAGGFVIALVVGSPALANASLAALGALSAAVTIAAHRMDRAAAAADEQRHG